MNKWIVQTKRPINYSPIIDKNNLETYTPYYGNNSIKAVITFIREYLDKNNNSVSLITKKDDNNNGYYINK